jgi:hypothetical protein
MPSASRFCSSFISTTRRSPWKLSLSRGSLRRRTESAGERAGRSSAPTISSVWWASRASVGTPLRVTSPGQLPPFPCLDSLSASAACLASGRRRAPCSAERTAERSTIEQLAKTRRVLYTKSMAAHVQALGRRSIDGTTKIIRTRRRCAQQTGGRAMDLEREQFRQTYAQLESGELLALHSRGALIDSAYDVLEEEIRSRNIPIPARPVAPVIVDKPGPIGGRILGFLVALFVVNLLWVVVIKPLIGGGLVPLLVLNVLPCLWLYRKLFAKKAARPATGGTPL